MGKTTLFLNGEILTANARDELAEAMLIEDERILFVGDEEDALALADFDTEVVDLEEKSIIPGFINTYPTSVFSEGAETRILEARACEALANGWTSLRLSSDSLAVLRGLVARGEVTATVAPYLFRLYERAELLAERCRFIRLKSTELESESAFRKVEWALSDRRPIAFDVSDGRELREVREFLLSFSTPRIGTHRNRLYLSGGLSPQLFPFLLSHRLLPIFLERDPESAASLLALRELGLSAVLASSELLFSLLMLSETLAPLGDDYRSVPSLVTAATLHAAELELAEAELGSLEWGKFADFLILSEPLVGCPPSRLPSLGIAECWIGGRRLAFPPSDAFTDCSKIIFKKY